MATKTQKPSQEKEETRKRYIIDSSSLFPITKKLNDDANERNSYQKRLLFKANDYLCKQNNKRSFFSRKQRHKAFRSFPNRYLFCYTNKVTSLFSIRYVLRIILLCDSIQIATPCKWDLILYYPELRYQMNGATCQSLLRIIDLTAFLSIR